jgi:hypothetical protein
MGFFAASPGIAAGVGAVKGLFDSDKASGLQDKATKLKLAEYQRNAPLRDRARFLAMQGVGQRPDLGGIFGDSGNPYSRGGMLSQLYTGIGPKPGEQPFQWAPPVDDPQAKMGGMMRKLLGGQLR